MDGVKQLEHEIRRHLELAKLTGGTVRQDHINAAIQLMLVWLEIGGDGQSQRSRSAGDIRSRLRRLLGKKARP